MLSVKLFQIQKPMMNVCYALIPLGLAAVYLFGLRCLLVIGVVLIFGIGAEALFTLKQGKPVTSAVFVTGLIFALSLPPTIPLWMAVVGIIFGVVFGKMVFGGFGQNVFNPAMVGRCFIYIAFPKELTNDWIAPMWGGAGGFASWHGPMDAVTGATPLISLKSDVAVPLGNLFFGNVSGSMGETSAFLILLGGIFIVYKKSASWRLALSCLLGGILTNGALGLAGAASAPSVAQALCAGAFLFGCTFVVTEPVSGAKTKPGQWIYGSLVGGLTMLLREYSNFVEGMMFAVLLMNAFVPIIDHTIGLIQAGGKVSNE